MIYTVTLNPAIDKTAEVPSFSVDTVNRITSFRTDPGGKGINVSKVIHELGGKSMAIGILGGENGQYIENALHRMGIETDFLFVEGETRTNLKIVDPVLHTNTDINEPGMTVSAAVLDRLLDRLLGRLQQEDLVILSGSVPNGAPDDTYQRWVSLCREKGAKVFLDADRAQLSEGIQASPYLIKPNKKELSALMGRELPGVKEIQEAARLLGKQYGIQKVVVSLGSEGCVYSTDRESIYAEGLSVPVGSTVGAGDSVVAALAVAEENHYSSEETVRFLTATSAANVMESGSQAAKLESVRELLPDVVLHSS